MNKRTKWILRFTAACLLIVAVCFCFARDTSSVDYHLRRLDSIRKLKRYADCPSSNITRESVNWNLHGRPSLKQLRIDLDRHETALMRLGYFERREVPFRNPNAYSMLEFMVWVPKAGGYPPHSSFSWTTNFALLVTARPNDMRIWETRVTKFDAK